MNNQEMIRIEGGSPLYGELSLQGSKNATLPVLVACILIEGKVKLKNCPDILDVSNMLQILQHIGCSISKDAHELVIDAGNITTSKLPGKFVKQMRSSVLMLGSLLARTKEAWLDYPGGCVLGERPIDLHIQAMEKLGASIQINGEYLIGKAHTLHGNSIVFPFPSVGATQNAILTAVLAKGDTYLYPAAREPEVVTLCEFLTSAGAEIEGAGTSFIHIHGVEKLHEAEFTIPGDRIVAGTYLFLMMGTKGRLCLHEVPVKQLTVPLEYMERMGAKLVLDQNDVELEMMSRPVNPSYVETGSYPDFPTDLQSSLLTLACLSHGTLRIRETIFSNRFKICEELLRMGARISIEKDQAFVQGVDVLEGRNVIARELRGGAALVAAGLAAQGVTTVMDAGYIKRGYEDIVGDLQRLGAKITLVP